MTGEMRSMAVAQATQRSPALVWILNFILLGAGNLYGGAWISGILGLLILAVGIAVVILTVGFGSVVVGPIILICWIILSAIGHATVKRKNLRAIDRAFDQEKV